MNMLHRHKHPAGSLERLYADYRRTVFVYGIAIVILAAVFTSVVWFTPGFQVTFSWTNPRQADTVPIPSTTTPKSHSY